MLAHEAEFWAEQLPQFSRGPTGPLFVEQYGQVACNGKHSLPAVRTRPVTVPYEAAAAARLVAQKALGEYLVVGVELGILA